MLQKKKTVNLLEMYVKRIVRTIYEDLMQKWNKSIIYEALLL